MYVCMRMCACVDMCVCVRCRYAVSEATFGSVAFGAPTATLALASSTLDGTSGSAGAVGEVLDFTFEISLVEGTTAIGAVVEASAGLAFVSWEVEAFGSGVTESWGSQTMLGVASSTVSRVTIGGTSLNLDLGSVVNQHDGDSGNDFLRFRVGVRVTTAASNVAGASLALVGALVYVSVVFVGRLLAVLLVGLAALVAVRVAAAVARAGIEVVSVNERCLVLACVCLCRFVVWSDCEHGRCMRGGDCCRSAVVLP
jgi:hypothetical protein